MTVTIRAQIAGMMFLVIREVRLILKASETAMVFGFGEMMLPAFPPPIIARSSDCLLYPASSPIASAIGATVITEISINTPTAQMIIVARATAKSALRLPSFRTMTCAIFSADPVRMSAPARMPEVMIRRTEVIMLPAPVIMESTVTPRFPPEPISPPTRAPMIRL